MSAIKVQNISKSFDKHAVLHDITFAIDEGEYVTVLGPSGCGKTTLLKTIAGLYPPDSGRVFIQGNDVTHLDPEARNVGFFFQNYALFPHLTVRENVGYGLSIKGVGESKRNKIVYDNLKLIGLEAWMDHYPRELSGGMQQRVALARALATGSKIMLFDEPLSALDAKMAAILRHELKILAHKLGLTVLHVTPNQDEAIELSDRVVLLKDGKLVQCDSAVDSYAHPKTPFAAYFIGESNFLFVKRITLHTARFDTTVLSVSREISEQKVVLAIRSEKIIFGEHERNTLKGVVSAINFLGKTTRFEIKYRGDVISVETSKHPEIAVGDVVPVYFPPDDLMIFNEKECQESGIPVI